MIADNSSSDSELNPDPQNTSIQKQERPSRDHKRTTVRFTDDEFDQITEEAKLSGETIPALLKKSHFRGKKLRLLFDEADRHWICSELRRIGNNVNQIAKRVNSGALEGWHAEFAKVTKDLSAIFRMVVDVYGSR
jgi:hypothetical protein